MRLINDSRIFQKIGLLSIPIFFLNSFAFLIYTKPLMTQEYSIPQERELYNTLPSSEKKGGILDATNPMELMNLLRKATAMDDATSPSDAIDQALKAFEEADEKSLSEDVQLP